MHFSYFDISLEIKILIVMCDIYANGIILYVGGIWSTKEWNQKNFLFSLLEITNPVSEILRVEGSCVQSNRSKCVAEEATQKHGSTLLTRIDKTGNYESTFLAQIDVLDTN